jgi:predicted amidohydrolase YtcJ
VHKAKIVTMDNHGQVAEAMAVRGSRILAVGSDAEITACANERTKVLDLGGKTILPGLIDVHTHAIDWAKAILRDEIDANFPKVRTVADIVEKVRQRAEAAELGEWIVGYGWDDAKLEERRYVAKQDLDPVSPENPVYLVHVSGHLSLANSAALKLAGITADTQDPEGGLIERDAVGEPTGILKDTAMPMVARLLPGDPPDLPSRAAKVVSERALGVGLTTIHDIWVSPEDMRGYQEAYQSGDLKVRVQMVPGVRNIEDAETLAAQGLHTGFGNDHLKLGAVKLFTDGGMGARTVAIYDPPVAGEADNYGLLLWWDSDDLQKAHKTLAEAGWQIVTHAIGDRAIDQALDSYQVVMKELDLTEPRFRIAHCGISTPAIQKRLRELKVMVDGNPSFIYWIGSWFLKYGPERVRWSYPGKSYFDNGIVAGAGSDVGVTPISPWWGIWAGVVRREMNSGELLAPEERLTVPQVLQLYTKNGAYIGFEETEKGSLELGKLADFIVVDRDVLSVPHDELKDVQVLMTFVGGKLVYERE